MVFKWKLLWPITVLSAIIIATCGCAYIPRPDTNLCVVNVVDGADLHLSCLNLKSDYNNDGRILPGHELKRINFSSQEQFMEYINKNTCTTPDGLANLKAYIKKLREAYEENQ